MHVGLQTSGYHACHICGSHLEARHSMSWKKMVHEVHTRYLPSNHSLREGIIGPKSPILKASDWLDAWNARNREERLCGMKRLSIFHDLPYWGDFQIIHLLNPMHIFKNVDAAIWTHLVSGRDTLGACEDLQARDRIWELWQARRGARVVLLKAPWVCSKREEAIVKKDIASFRTPMGRMHFLRGAFTKDNKLSGLKSHDCHKMLQV